MSLTAWNHQARARSAIPAADLQSSRVTGGAASTACAQQGILSSRRRTIAAIGVLSFFSQMVGKASTSDPDYSSLAQQKWWKPGESVAIVTGGEEALLRASKTGTLCISCSLTLKINYWWHGMQPTRALDMLLRASWPRKA